MPKAFSYWARAAWGALVFALGSTAQADTVTVFAAASLKNALEEIASGFEEQTGHTVVLSLAGSSVLARQIQAGAPADVFVSANESWMDVLERDGLIHADTRKAVTANTLVIVAPRDEAEPLALDDAATVLRRLGERPMAMALVEAVPAGIYGRQALGAMGLWSDLRSRVAQTDNVRAALALVAAQEAALGIVYASDAVVEDRVEVVAAIPGDTHDPILYPAAIVEGRTTAPSVGFVNLMTSPEGSQVFERHGFAPLEATE